jgi:hypothetical protein
MSRLKLNACAIRSGVGNPARGLAFSLSSSLKAGHGHDWPPPKTLSLKVARGWIQIRGVL